MSIMGIYAQEKAASLASRPEDNDANDCSCCFSVVFQHNIADFQGSESEKSGIHQMLALKCFDRIPSPI